MFMTTNEMFKWVKDRDYIIRELTAGEAQYFEEQNSQRHFTSRRGSVSRKFVKAFGLVDPTDDTSSLLGFIAKYITSEGMQYKYYRL